MNADIVVEIATRLSWWERHTLRRVCVAAYIGLSRPDTVRGLGMIPVGGIPDIAPYPTRDILSLPDNTFITVLSADSTHRYLYISSILAHVEVLELANFLLPTTARRALYMRGIFNISIMDHILRYDDPVLFENAVDILHRDTGCIVSINIAHVGPRIYWHDALVRDVRCTHHSCEFAWRDTFLYMHNEGDDVGSCLEYAISTWGDSVWVRNLVCRGITPASSTIVRYILDYGLPLVYPMQEVLSCEYDIATRYYETLGRPMLNFDVVFPCKYIWRFITYVGANITISPTWGLVMAIYVGSTELLEHMVKSYDITREQIASVAGMYTPDTAAMCQYLTLLGIQYTYYPKYSIMVENPMEAIIGGHRYLPYYPLDPRCVGPNRRRAQWGAISRLTLHKIAGDVRTDLLYGVPADVVYARAIDIRRYEPVISVLHVICGYSDTCVSGHQILDVLRECGYPSDLFAHYCRSRF